MGDEVVGDGVVGEDVGGVVVTTPKSGRSVGATLTGGGVGVGAGVGQFSVIEVQSSMPMEGK